MSIEKKWTIQAVMDKITSQAIALILIVIGIFTAFIIALVLYGVDVALAVLSGLSFFIGIVGVYFGLIVTENRTKQLLDIIEVQNKKEEAMNATLFTALTTIQAVAAQNHIDPSSIPIPPSPKEEKKPEINTKVT